MAEYTRIGTMEKNPLAWGRSSRGQKPKWAVVDIFLVLLEDSQWHSVKEIEEQVAIPVDTLALVLSLFTELDFISRSGAGSEVRLNSLGSKFLELPLD